MPIEEILKISQGLLTPIIGIVATYIAWQQLRRLVSYNLQGSRTQSSATAKHSAAAARRRRLEVTAVTCGAVRCRAWLGVAIILSSVIARILPIPFMVASRLWFLCRRLHNALHREEQNAHTPAGSQYRPGSAHATGTRNTDTSSSLCLQRYRDRALTVCRASTM